MAVLLVFSTEKRRGGFLFALWAGGTQHPSRAPCRPLRPACLARCCPDEPEGTAQGACIGCLSHAPARTEELNVGYNSKARRAGLIVLYNTEPLSLRAATPGAGPAAQPGTPRQNRASGEPFTPGIEHGRTGRVALAAGPNSPAPSALPPLCRKDNGNPKRCLSPLLRPTANRPSYPQNPEMISLLQA